MTQRLALRLGPIFDGKPFMTAFTGQIPFTLMYLLGTITFSVLLSPALYRWVIQNEKNEFSFLGKCTVAIAQK